MRFLRLATAALLAIGCKRSPAPVADKATPDASQQEWYNQTTAQVSALSREAERLFRSGKPDEAARLIGQAQVMTTHLLETPRPTVAALEAASDVDQLYGNMLLANRHYGAARMFFQKNVARWKYRTPQTGEAIRRQRLAQAGIAECDRLLGLNR